MKDATKAITEVYSLEDLKEIANHGCKSGVCSQHIYYGDTIKFYDTYEVQILDELVLNYGYEFLVELFEKNNANLIWYKNAVVWAFIELTAIEAIEDAAYTEDAVTATEALGNKVMAMGL